MPRKVEMKKKVFTAYIWKGWTRWGRQPYIGFALHPKKGMRKDLVRVRLTIEEVGK